MEKGSLKAVMKRYFLFGSLFLATAFAAEKPVLDFEADVIEGEKRKPDLFIQLEGGAADSMDSILYSRDDFNDYQEIDRKWRPKMRRIKGSGGKNP